LAEGGGEVGFSDDGVDDIKSEVGSKFKLNCVETMVEAMRRSEFGSGR
jgi:hypothetical protein